MTHRMYAALIASVGALALVLDANDTFAGSAGAAHGAVASPAMSHHPVGPLFRHHRRSWTFVPGGGFFAGGYYDGAPIVDIPQPMSNEVRYTYTYDVPWDWAHRYPPAVVPSDRPYVSSCPAETVTVPGRGGSEHTVNVMRCY